MGRSFDRGGRSRKEREYGKRRSYQQAERDKEARAEVMRAKRRPNRPTAVQSRSSHSAAAAPVVNAPTTLQSTPVNIVERKRPGFLSKIISRIFKKSA